jgi:rubrerythrin
VLLVPDLAVLRSGTKNVVFVAVTSGKFEPRRVKLGARAEDDMIQVLAGLEAGERIVTSGQFLLDSESQLREAINKMLHPTQPAPAAVGAVETTTAAEATVPAPGKTVYLCPMPEHVAIQYDQAGPCPLCGMTLVPVSEDQLEKIQPGGVVEYYTCPMPEHADVRRDQSGVCPRCRMTLIPVMPKPPEPPSASEAEAPLPPLFTCPMASHAHIVTDQPGKCPECEMVLVPTSTVKHRKQAETNWRKQHQH